MKDKRPAGVIGKEREIVHDNLVMLQTKLGYSNSEMAELLGVEKKYYERIKRMVDHWIMGVFESPL